MATLQFPGSKGVTASMESGVFKLLGSGLNHRFRGLRTFSWKEEIGGEEAYGNGPRAVGRTIGQYKASIDIEQLLTEYTFMVESMSALGLTTFSLSVTWREGSRVQRVEVTDALLKTSEGSVSQGGGPVTIKYSCNCSTEYIKVNGRTLIDEELLYRAGPRIVLPQAA